MVSPFFAFDGDWQDFFGGVAGFLSGFALVLRSDCELVLLVARQLLLAGDVLGEIAHVVALEGIG